MKYELLFQAPRPGVPYESTQLDSLLAERTTVRGDGTRLWLLKHGEVELRPLNEGGKTIATEVKVPLSGSLELIREVLNDGCEVAKTAGVVLFDPQLMKPLSPADEGAVTDQYLRSARYAGEMVGVSGAIGAGQPPIEEGFKPGTKVFLGLIGFFVLLYIIANKLL